MTHFAEQALDALTKRGFSKARVQLTESEHHELAAEFGELSLLRTNHDTSISLLGIVDDKQGSVSINKCTHEALHDAVEDLWQVAQGSRPDPANDIAERQPKASFVAGAEVPDHDAMFERLSELLDHSRTQYPTLKMGGAIVTFNKRRSRFLNSNGVDFESRRGSYGMSLMFTAKDGKDTSSFNYTGAALAQLDRPLKDCANADTLMRQTTEQVRTRKVPAKFTGDLVITPESLSDFLGFLTQNISDVPMIAKTSLYHGKLGAKVASAKLSLDSRPRELIGGYAITGDGYPAEDTTLVDAGVLRSNLLSLYGARKTGLTRAATTGGCYVVEAGSTPRDALIGEVERGVLITRFSGGRPNDKGDFSGIAKNSYYIEGGEVRYPLSETMVSGNMAELLANITTVSRERVDFGFAVYPWVRATGIGIS